MTEDAGRAGAVAVAALRAEHRALAIEAGDYGNLSDATICEWCSDLIEPDLVAWPCPWINVLDALVAAEQRIATHDLELRHWKGIAAAAEQRATQAEQALAARTAVVAADAP